MKKPLFKYSALGILVVVLGLCIWGAFFYLSLGNVDTSHEAQDNSKGVVTDVTRLYLIQTLGVVVPHTTEEVRQAVLSHDRVSIGGGRYSMGGQTASEKAVQIDMREFNKIISLSTTTKEIRVQAGIRWREIQKVIDPYDLSIQIMQTYSNFTVGGSLSVNVHGRYVGLGPVIMSVKEIELVLADGTIVLASPTKNADLFYSAIGGMGGIGVITEVTLGLADNINVRRERVKMPISEYKDYFFNTIRSSTSTIFHNGDIYPMDFDSVSAVSWKATDKPVTIETRLIPQAQEYRLEKMAWVVMSEWPFGKAIREYILEPLLYAKEAVHTRNYEASYDVAELEPKSRDESTYVLQEYFVPVEKFDEFYPKMKEVFVENDVNLLNVSIRHAEADPGALLAWAKKESFAFVVYYKQKTDAKSREHVAQWTREMIDQVIKVGGSYYLPYQPHATELQLMRAYPHILDFFDIKKHYDPTNKFTNNLWDTYYNPEKLDDLRDIQKAESFASTTPEYVRFSDNMYLSVPEWYIVYNAGEYANVLRDSLPSQFDYRGAIKEFWREHKAMNLLARGTEHQNANYHLVLKVIGWSFSFENGVKWVYENTIGRCTEWFAGNKQMEEDVLAARVARDYEVFIYDYPWYDFPYYQAYKDLSDLKDEKESYSFGERIRKIERQVFLHIEFGFKRFYSWVIRSASQSKFGVQDDVIHAVVKENGKYEILSAPHYHPFTKALLARMENAYANNSQFEVVEVAGNSEITLSYVETSGTASELVGKEILRGKETVAIKNGEPVLAERVTRLVATKDVYALFKQLKEVGISIGHFYDY